MLIFHGVSSMTHPTWICDSSMRKEQVNQKYSDPNGGLFDGDESHGTLNKSKPMGKVGNIFQFFVVSEMGRFLDDNHPMTKPKYPDPSKVPILRTRTPASYRFQPLHWRVLGDP